LMQQDSAAVSFFKSSVVCVAHKVTRNLILKRK